MLNLSLNMGFGGRCKSVIGVITTAFAGNRLVSGQPFTITLTDGDTIPADKAEIKINGVAATSVVRVSDTVMTGVAP